MDLQEIGCENMDCIHLTKDRIWWQGLMHTMVNLWVL